MCHSSSHFRSFDRLGRTYVRTNQIRFELKQFFVASILFSDLLDGLFFSFISSCMHESYQLRTLIGVKPNKWISQGYLLNFCWNGLQLQLNFTTNHDVDYETFIETPDRWISPCGDADKWLLISASLFSRNFQYLLAIRFINKLILSFCVINHYSNEKCVQINTNIVSSNISKKIREKKTASINKSGFNIIIYIRDIIFKTNSFFFVIAH